MRLRIGRLLWRHKRIAGWFHAAVHRDLWWRRKFAQYGCWWCRAAWDALQAEPK